MSQSCILDMDVHCHHHCAPHHLSREVCPYPSPSHVPQALSSHSRRAELPLLDRDRGCRSWSFVLRDHPPGVKHTRDPTQDGQQDVDEEVGVAASLQKDGQRRQEEAKKVEADIGRGRWRSRHG